MSGAEDLEVLREKALALDELATFVLANEMANQDNRSSVESFHEPAAGRARLMSPVEIVAKVKRVIIEGEAKQRLEAIASLISYKCDDLFELIKQAHMSPLPPTTDTLAFERASIRLVEKAETERDAALAQVEAMKADAKRQASVITSLQSKFDALASALANARSGRDCGDG